MKTGKIMTEIRKAVPEDAAVIVSLLYESFIAYKPLYTEKAFAATIAGQSEIENRIETKTVFIARYNNMTAGTVTLFPHTGRLHIRSMAVRPDARGKGVGIALLNHVQEFACAKEIACLTLRTTAFLSEAIRLYERFGFKQLEYDDLHDLHGTPLIQMIKSLKPITKNKIEKNDHTK